MLDNFLELGYKNSDEFYPHESSRHGYYRLEKNGRYYFAKYSKDQSLEQTKRSVAVDIWWCQAIQELRQTRDLNLRTPKIVDFGEDWYVAEWIEGQPSAKPTDSASALDQNLRNYAVCLATLDKIQPEWLTTSPPNFDDSTPFDQLDKRWEKWSKKPLEDGQLTRGELEAAHQIIQDYQPYIEPHLQHGDFVPWHILVDANQDWWLIDGEHANTQKPRYYDLAYMYSRIFTNMRSPEHASRLLKAFCEEANTSIETIYPALLPVMTSRAIGMQFDAVNDQHANDYKNEARELLGCCLSRDPNRL